MNLSTIRTAIEEAVSVSVSGIELPGIVDASVGSVAIQPRHLQQLAAQLEQHGHSEIKLSAKQSICRQFHTLRFDNR